MADLTPMTEPVVQAAPAAGVSVQPAPGSSPIVTQPAAPAPVIASPQEVVQKNWFEGFDWFKVLAYSVLVIVGVSYVKYTRDKAKKDSADISDLQSQLSTLTLKVSNLQPSSSSGS